MSLIFSRKVFLSAVILIFEAKQIFETIFEANNKIVYFIDKGDT